MDVFHNGCESSRRSKQKFPAVMFWSYSATYQARLQTASWRSIRQSLRVNCDMEQLEMHSSLTKKQGMVPQSASGCGMHDEKRVKWRVSRRVWRSAGMQSLVSCGRSPDSEVGGCVMRLLSADRETQRVEHKSKKCSFRDQDL